MLFYEEWGGDQCNFQDKQHDPGPEKFIDMEWGVPFEKPVWFWFWRDDVDLRKLVDKRPKMWENFCSSWVDGGSQCIWIEISSENAKPFSELDIYPWKGDCSIHSQFEDEVYLDSQQ